MVKHIKGRKLEKMLPTAKQIIVFPKSGATIETINRITRSAVNDCPNQIILHIGTNDLSSENSPQQIAESLVRLATETTTDDTTVTISGIVPRGDKYASKAKLVNNRLKLLCNERNICLLLHDNINPSHHLNGSKLHLNKKGNNLVSRNFETT